MELSLWSVESPVHLFSSLVHQFYSVPALPLDSTRCLSLGFLFLITFSKSHYGLFHNAFYSWFQVQTYCYFGGPCYSYLVICLYLMAVAIGTLVWDLTVKTHLMLLNIQMCKSTFQKTYNNRTNKKKHLQSCFTFESISAAASGETRD